jgi:hypothetical protein
MRIRIGINAKHMKKLKNYTFSQKFQYALKLLRIRTLMRKIRQCKVAMLRLKVFLKIWFFNM